MTNKISQTWLHKVVINMKFSRNDLRRLKEPQKIKKIIKKQSISKK